MSLNREQPMRPFLDELADAFEGTPLEYVRTFDTVADMQAATDLQAGMTCHTNGFHAAGDGGAAYYAIGTTGTANGMDVLAVGELFATLVVAEPYVTPEMFGAQNVETTDTVQYLNKALETGKPVNLNGNRYLCSENLHVIADAEIYNGSLLLEDGCSVIPYSRSKIHEVKIYVDDVTTDGVVILSNAYADTGDSAFKNVFENVLFYPTASPSAVLIKAIAYIDADSPNGRVSTAGLFDINVNNVNVATNEQYGKFISIVTNNSSAWITTCVFSNCWCARPEIAIETTNAGGYGAIDMLVFDNVRAQYITMQNALHILITADII